MSKLDDIFEMMDKLMLIGLWAVCLSAFFLFLAGLGVVAWLIFRMP